jgi:16S rRNA (uracil1498-N3)-methyltransferase
MPRRIHLPNLALGLQPLPPAAAHHLVRVLRLPDGERIEAFDSAGRTAHATLLATGTPPALNIESISEPPSSTATPPLAVATAVPKGDRADYLVEKLAELGVARWIPLDAARSVIVPKGVSKLARWEKIAIEAARQSHAPNVLTIADIASPLSLLTPAPTTPAPPVWIAATSDAALDAAHAPPPSLVLIGPEGGWAPDEQAQLIDAGALPISLGPTILRVETAAVVAAAAALARWRNTAPHR